MFIRTYFHLFWLSDLLPPVIVAGPTSISFGHRTYFHLFWSSDLLPTVFVAGPTFVSFGHQTYFHLCWSSDLLLAIFVAGPTSIFFGHLTYLHIFWSSDILPPVVVAGPFPPIFVAVPPSSHSRLRTYIHPPPPFVAGLVHPCYCFHFNTLTNYHGVLALPGYWQDYDFEIGYMNISGDMPCLARILCIRPNSGQPSRKTLTRSYSD